MGTKPTPQKEDNGGIPRDMAEEQMRDEGVSNKEIEETLGKKPVSTKSVKMPVKKEDKPKEKTVKVPVKEDESEGEVEEATENFDFSEIDPEKEWECFGQIEPEHLECKGCAYRIKCADKSGVKL